VTSSWFFLSTLNYGTRSTTHQIYKNKTGLGTKTTTTNKRNMVKTQLSTHIEAEECHYVTEGEANVMCRNAYHPVASRRGYGWKNATQICTCKRNRYTFISSLVLNIVY